MKRTESGGGSHQNLTTRLDFADDIALISPAKQQMQKKKPEEWKRKQDE